LRINPNAALAIGYGQSLGRAWSGEATQARSFKVMLATWQSILFLIGVLFIGTPDGVEIINLTAAILVAIAFIPYGLKLIFNKTT